MASLYPKLFKIIRNTSVLHRNITSTAICLAKLEEKGNFKLKEYKTENYFLYLEDPDNFGTLSTKVLSQSKKIEDEGDIREKNYQENAPLPSQKLTIRQYAQIIKDYLKLKRLKEAIDVLEMRMLVEDRVAPENYIYNILIGACADVGYTKKAFKLYNDMKRRGLKATGDTYTCLFHCCANSPWQEDGLKRAHDLRALMIEKGIEPNTTNYNAMIKSFGRCGDLATAFKIVDEMIQRKIKIRVHTFNHLLHGCISDKNLGLRHAIVVWRKMLSMREKPNIYSFNLMLKCVQDCKLGTKADIEELIGTIQNQMLKHDRVHKRLLEPSKLLDSKFENKAEHDILHMIEEYSIKNQNKSPDNKETDAFKTDDESTAIEKSSTISITVMDNLDKNLSNIQKRTVPNLLSKDLNLDHVLGLQEVHTNEEKFVVVGGQEDFLKEMEMYSVKPDIKTFTQMLPLIENTRVAEDRLLETIKLLNVKADIDFYNMLIKKRCLRFDYDGAFMVKDIIEKEDKLRKKKHPQKKKLRLNLDIMSYGTLALACKSKESAEQLLNEMKEKQLKVNIQILGSLLKHGTAHTQFGYVHYIMNVVKDENIKPNDVFLKHLEAFHEKCLCIQDQQQSVKFANAFKHFTKMYNNWLQEMNINDEVLQSEHPWRQFREKYPETVQRQSIKISEPKRFFRNKKRKFVMYRP